ncbi:MAG: hypothetical protein ACR2LZ_03470 [Pyrinomonadaceae bacterium]
MSNGDPVVIKGGSIEIEFDDTFMPDPNAKGKKKFKDANRKITGVEVTDEHGNVLCAVTLPKSLQNKCVVRIKS